MKVIPRTRLGTWWRIALAAVVVIGFAAATTTVAGLLQVKNVVDVLNQSKPLTDLTNITLPAPGKPETILLIGADHRVGQGTGYGNTDTMMLARINDSSSTINLLSVPRDLAVTDPDGQLSKLNAIYSGFGPNALLHTLSHQVFPGLKINHVIIVDFLGFSRMVTAIGCVYTDVDHRYYNNTAITDYSSIDIQPGYQRLCGWNAAANGALAFVRFRHTDTDIVRNARQQDFIRWAKQNYTTSELLDNETKLLNIFGRNSQSDSFFHTSDSLIDLAQLVIDASGATLKSIPFPVVGYPTIGGVDYVQSNDGLERKAFKEFMTPTLKAMPKPHTSVSGHRGRHHKKAFRLSSAGLTSDPGDGRSQAAQLSNTGQLAHGKLPIYYPTLIDANSDYCFSITDNCDTYQEPASAYDGSYPRRYSIKAPSKTRYPAYVMTLEADPSSDNDDYYTISGTTWSDPPLLRSPTGHVTVHGRKLLEYENGGKMSVVAFRTRKAWYFVSNTLEDLLPNSEMLSIAASMKPAS